MSPSRETRKQLRPAEEDWGGRGERTTANRSADADAQRTPAWKPQRICKGKMGCDASEVDHRWTSPRRGKKEAHAVAVELDRFLVLFFFLYFFFSAIGYGSNSVNHAYFLSLYGVHSCM